MEGVPFELILLLLLAAALVFNYLMQQAARRRQAEAAQQEAAQHEPAQSGPAPETIPERAWRAQPAAEPSTAATYVASPHRPPAPTASAVRPRRRFARQTLFGSRRKLQDAFVVATILGRCRGDEPHRSR